MVARRLRWWMVAGWLAAGPVLAGADWPANSENQANATTAQADPDDLMEQGLAALNAGDLPQAEALLRRALARFEQRGPGSRSLAACLDHLGLVLRRRSRLGAAIDCYRRALPLWERLAPDSEDLVICLMNLGAAYFYAGENRDAQEQWQRALDILTRVLPGSRFLPMILDNLGALALDRGDLEAARDYQQRALTVLGRLAPDSPDYAMALCNAATIKLRAGELDGARHTYEQALALLAKVAPKSLARASAIDGLGIVAVKAGDAAAAERWFTQALALREQMAPGSLDVAVSCHQLGVIAIQRRDFRAARTWCERAVALRERLAPHSLLLGTSLSNLGLLELLENRPRAAQAVLTRAVEVAENERSQLGSPSSRALITLQAADHYALLCMADLALGDQAAAFGVLERMRGRSLAEEVSQRFLEPRGVPNGLLQQQRDLDGRRRLLYGALGTCRLDTDEGRVQTLRRDLELVDLEQRRLADAVRQAAPAYGSLAYPQPLTTPQVQAALEPGTLLLCYMVYLHQVFIFAVTREQVTVHQVDAGEGDLERQVAAFRLGLQSPRNAFRAAGERLYALLVAPVRQEAAAAQRLLICPDGPLFGVPFGALITGDRDGRPRFLIEDKPLHTAVSVGVLQESRKRRAEADWATPFVGFGDPLYERPATGRVEFGRRGGELAPLPGTRHELEEAAATVGGGALLRLGAEATCPAVQRDAPTARIVHFACHGLLDDRDPLGSCLALTATHGDDGLLRAYQIIESLRLEADLVVLSACQTGLGQQTRHEGVLGLTRAFQCAGADSVLVSLWNVSDESTARLMTEFYRHLLRGAAKDQALQRAQLTLLEGTDGRWRHPFHWAAFELVGDWR